MAETLVALVIVGIVASAFLGLLVTTMGASRANEARVAANQIAQDYLEKVIENPWSSIGLYSTDSGYQATTASGESTVTLTTSPRPTNVPSPLVSTTVKGVSYSIRTDVGWYDDPSDGTGAADANGNTNDIKHVVVTVSWTRNGTPFSVSVNDYRAPTATEVPPTVSILGLFPAWCVRGWLSAWVLRRLKSAATSAFASMSTESPNSWVR